MQNFYVDESGSITKQTNARQNKYFIISIIRVIDEKMLRRAFKRFVSSNIQHLKTIDLNNRMFDSITGKFKELKGCAFDYEMKNKFIDFFLQHKYFEIFYIRLNNLTMDDHLSENKARCFNFLIKKTLEYNIKKGNLPHDDYKFHIDERNIRTEAKYTLEDYLNTELKYNGIMPHDVKVRYYDSCNNNFIQIADVFANIYYSNLYTGNYKDKIEKMISEGFIKNEFVFPKKGKK